MSDDSEKISGIAIMSMARDIDELKAEIERLRHEVKLREQICADATLYARRLQEADDENNRLRELLRPFAALDQPHNARKADDHPLFAINSAVITCGDVRRVREVLGERDEQPC